MVNGNAYSSYKNSIVYEDMDPKELILILYNEALRRITQAKEGVLEGNPQKRGENLSKAIAIVAELNSCLDEKIGTDEIHFLRGLYRAILIELPKVNISNDIKTLELAYSYIAELKNIWETNVMGRKLNKQANQTDFKSKDVGDEPVTYENNSSATHVSM